MIGMTAGTAVIIVTVIGIVVAGIVAETGIDRVVVGTARIEAALA
ncbi:hypothetical protein CEV31_2116 [Brucella thiophenivorans]|uniref:Uncharacterized protein n=1 Tax=Brucella thiophenivorans TaxID=571255 RepID=A0A256FVA2_9HYPH|nr:hypothetical protein CEV31_2116 [Brucella thiophenivorans]